MRTVTRILFLAVTSLCLTGILGAQALRQSSPDEQLLHAHNQLRFEMGLPELRWSPELAASSQYWANTLLRSGEFRHDGDHTHGQNLFAITQGRATPEFVFQAWASEAADYDYNRNACRDVCGHYTQMVWRSTRLVGCAVARNTDREVWVCDYYPAGNVVGQRPY